MNKDMQLRQKIFNFLDRHKFSADALYRYLDKGERDIWTATGTLSFLRKNGFNITDAEIISHGNAPSFSDKDVWLRLMSAERVISKWL